MKPVYGGIRICDFHNVAIEQYHKFIRGTSLEHPGVKCLAQGHNGDCSRVTLCEDHSSKLAVTSPEP